MSGGRLPPQNLDAEAAVISACLLMPTHLDDVRSVLPAGDGGFYSDANRRVYEAMCAIVDAGTPLDIVAVANHLRDTNRLQQVGGTPYLYQLIDATPAVTNVTAHALIVRDLWRVRRAIETGQRVAAEGHGTLGDGTGIQQWLEQAESNFSDLAHLVDTRKLRPLSDVLQDVYADVQAAHTLKTNITGVASGFRDIDRMLGGFRGGDLITVAARPGMGKSALVEQFAINAARSGNPAAIFSLEMPSLQLGMRLVASESKIDLGQLRLGAFSPSLWPQIVNTISMLSPVPVWIDDTPAISVFEMRSRARRLSTEISQKTGGAGKLGLIVIDYLQLMSPPERSRSREQEVGAISRSLKEIAKQLQVPVIAVSALNRGAEQRQDKRPQLSDLRESGSIEQDADVVMMLYRPGYYDRKNDPALKGWAEVLIEKQRNGPTGMVKLSFQEKLARFDDFADEYAGDFFDARDTAETYTPPKQAGLWDEDEKDGD